MRWFFKDRLNLPAFSSLTWVWVIPVLTTLTKGVTAVEVVLRVLFTSFSVIQCFYGCVQAGREKSLVRLSRGVKYDRTSLPVSAGWRFAV